MRTWRDSAAPIIAEIIHKHGRERTPELKKALFEAYPFGMRQYWPYKVWLSEIRNQLEPKIPFEDPDQLRLFS